MDSSKNLILNLNSTIKEALSALQYGTYKIVLVTNKHNKLLGTLTDGDIRRALLKQYSLDNKIENIINRNPATCNINDPKEKIIQLALSKKLHIIPIVDENSILVDIEDINLLLNTPPKKNKVILMVGGLGTRLHPLTQNTPKPLLKVGNKPILETIIENFAKYGFVDIILSVNYKASMIEKYFSDGSSFGVNISYIYEKDRLGTAGSLSLLTNTPDVPFFVMNGDLLTDINFQHLLNHHIKSDVIATMTIREIKTQIPYGVIETRNNIITSIKEKPTTTYHVNAGIYILNPATLKYIPNNKFFDMPTLFETLIKNNLHTTIFNNNGYWIDIGQHSDYEKANLEFGNL